MFVFSIYIVSKPATRAVVYSYTATACTYLPYV